MAGKAKKVAGETTVLVNMLASALKVSQVNLREDGSIDRLYLATCPGIHCNCAKCRKKRVT